MERKLTILLNENGTVQILPDDLSSNQQRWVSGTFLILGFCFGVGLGLVSLSGLRTKFCQKSLIGLQLSALFDCAQGQVFGAIFLVLQPNDNWCRLSACTSTTFLVIETVEMTLLTLPPQIFLVDAFPWILGLFIAVFILTDTQQASVNFYPSRYGCSVVSGGYGWYQMIMIIILGSSWLGTALGLTHGAICRENHLDVIISRIITILYIILVLPFSLILISSTTNKIYTGNSTDIVESVFMWARYQFNIAVPIVILLLNKQVRKKSESFLCWCKNNTIHHTPNRTLNNNTLNKLRNIKRRKKLHKTVSYNDVKPNPSTPVLFATSNGLHLRTVELNNDELPSTSESSNEKSIICELCDLTQSEMLTSKITTLKSPMFLSTDNKKNVRFASPQILDIPLAESGVWSNTEEAEALRFQSVPNSQEEKNLSRELGVTFTKV